MANKTMHKTKPARGSFCIIVRSNGVGGVVGCVLPVKARDLLVILGVRRRLVIRFFEAGGHSG